MTSQVVGLRHVGSSGGPVGDGVVRRDGASGVCDLLVLKGEWGSEYKYHYRTYYRGTSGEY